MDIHILMKSILIKKVECFGYDYSGFYLSMMQQIKIPTEKGKQYIINDISLIEFDKPAFYRIDIKYKNKILEKIFQFTKTNVYTNYQVKQLMYIHNNYPNHFKQEDVTISFIMDGKANAYIYDNWISGEEIFGFWFYKMMELKKELPKNKLVKWLTSTLHGYLSQYNYIYLSSDEMMERDDISSMLIKDVQTKQDGSEYFKCIDPENIAKFGGFALLKPFVSGFGRMILAKAITILDKTPQLDTFVRCYTDGVTFTEEKIFKKTKNFKLLIPEDKTTGTMLWSSIQSYYNYDTKEGHGKYKNQKP